MRLGLLWSNFSSQRDRVGAGLGEVAGAADGPGRQDEDQADERAIARAGRKGRTDRMV